MYYRTLSLRCSRSVVRKSRTAKQIRFIVCQGIVGRSTSCRPSPPTRRQCGQKAVERRFWWRVLAVGDGWAAIGGDKVSVLSARGAFFFRARWVFFHPERTRRSRGRGPPHCSNINNMSARSTLEPRDAAAVAGFLQLRCPAVVLSFSLLKAGRGLAIIIVFCSLATI